MPIRRRRAGRQSWATRRRFNDAVGDAVAALAQKKWKYSVEQTNAIFIERTAKADGSKETITFSKAHGELSLWKPSTFKDIFDENNSELGFLDLLADAFLAGKTVTTAKAEYRLQEETN